MKKNRMQDLERELGKLKYRASTFVSNAKSLMDEAAELSNDVNTLIEKTKAKDLLVPTEIKLLKRPDEVIFLASPNGDMVLGPSKGQYQFVRTETMGFRSPIFMIEPEHTKIADLEIGKWYFSSNSFGPIENQILTTHYRYMLVLAKVHDLAICVYMDERPKFNALTKPFYQPVVTTNINRLFRIREAE